MTEPRPWPNNMRYLRDDTAERLIIIHRRAQRLRDAAQTGQTTRLETITELNRIIEETLRAILNLSKAGAPIDINALNNHIQTILIDRH